MAGRPEVFRGDLEFHRRDLEAEISRGARCANGIASSAETRKFLFATNFPGLPAALYPCAVSGLPRKPENGFSRRIPARIKSRRDRGRTAVFRGNLKTASHAATWLELRASQVADGQRSSAETRKFIIAIRKRELPAAHGARMA